MTRSMDKIAFLRSNCVDIFVIIILAKFGQVVIILITASSPYATGYNTALRPAATRAFGTAFLSFFSSVVAHAIPMTSKELPSASLLLLRTRTSPHLSSSQLASLQQR